MNSLTNCHIIKMSANKISPAVFIHLLSLVTPKPGSSHSVCGHKHLQSIMFHVPCCLGKINIFLFSLPTTTTTK